MAIYVDNVQFAPLVRERAARHGHRWCHLWCDPGDEIALHRLAEGLGLRLDWYQHHRVQDHYDLTPLKRDEALRLGAQPMNLRTWLARRARSAMSANTTDQARGSRVKENA